MKVRKIESYPSTKCMIEDGESILTIEYGYNNDLYWNLDNPNKELDYDKEFELDFNVNKKDRKIYNLFNIIYSEIKNINGEEEVKLVSAEVEEMVANYLIINKDEENIILNFHTKKPIEGHKKDLGSAMHIPIRISSDSDYYFPMSLMFDNLLHIDDIMGYTYVPEERKKKKKVLSRRERRKRERGLREKYECRERNK